MNRGEERRDAGNAGEAHTLEIHVCAKVAIRKLLKKQKRLCYLGKAPLLFLPPRVHATLPALASLAFLCRPSS